MPTLILNQHPRRASQRLLRRAVKETLLTEGINPRGVEVSILLTDDASIRELNLRYRKMDQPTDVLSFSQEQSFDFPASPRLLGDVIISIDTAIVQAKAGGRTLDEEVSQLAIHGTLHLLGYDDATPSGYKTMVAKGTDIWQRVQHADNSAAKDN